MFGPTTRSAEVAVLFYIRVCNRAGEKEREVCSLVGPQVSWAERVQRKAA